MRNLALALAVVVFALAGAARADQRVTVRSVELPWSILSSGHQAAIPDWARRGYALRADDPSGRVYLFTRLNGSDIFVVPATWQSLRYDFGLGSIYHATLPAVPNPALRAGAGPGEVINYGVDVDSLRSESGAGTISTNDPELGQELAHEVFSPASGAGGVAAVLANPLFVGLALVALALVLHRRRVA